MFFITKNKVRQETVKAVSLMVRTLEKTGSIPPGFWDDITASAFFHGLLIATIPELSIQKYTGAVAAEFPMTVFDDILGSGRGIEIGRMHSLLMTLDTFREAFQAGTLSCVVTKVGPERFLGDPIIQRATRNLLSHEPSTGANISAVLQQIYFYDRAEALRTD